jgi:hypothetical protein
MRVDLAAGRGVVPCGGCHDSASALDAHTGIYS